MTRLLFLPLAVVLVLSSVLFGAQTESWQTGKIVAVEKHEPELPCCYSGSDAPLQSNVTVYDVSVQIGDILYIGRYQTWTGYLPITWAKDHLVLARPNQHFIYLKTSSGEEIRVSLLSRKPTKPMSKERH